MKKFGLTALLLLLLPLPLFAQTTGSITGVALDSVGNTIAGVTITACPPNSPGIPCTPVVASTISNGQGSFAMTVPIGTYQLTLFRLGIIATSSLITVSPSNITVANNVNYSGTVTFSQPIISTVSTGTAPFSIASTTVTPNLNAQLHNGLTAPTSAIVGISDTQTLTAKTLTSPTITGPTTTGTDSGTETMTNKTLTSPTVNSPTITNPTITGGGSWAGSPSLTTPTIDGTAAGHVVLQVSAATNYGTALGSQAIIASMPFTTSVSLLLMPVQVTAGVGCSAATNSVTVNPVTWTGPGGTAESINPSSNMGFTGNGAVDQGSSTFGSSGFTNNGIQAVVAKSGTAIAYSTTSSLGSTGCSTVPQYAIYAKAIF